jgi:uridine kinase
MVQIPNTEKEKTNFTKPTCTSFRNLLKELKQPVIIGIAGDSGSGKIIPIESKN